ncbi:hypothetical protein IT084_08370 [Desulfallas sp. Bu1-1]|nr:hypothetical protein [Desulfallas sp. Bu1-1]
MPRTRPAIPGARCGSTCRECTWASFTPAKESFCKELNQHHF